MSWIRHFTNAAQLRDKHALADKLEQIFTAFRLFFWQPVLTDTAQLRQKL